jgi:hypothetical protein
LANIATDASHLIIFANQTNVGEAEIDAYLQNTSTTRVSPLEALAGYGAFMKGTINPDAGGYEKYLDIKANLYQFH